MKPTRRDKHEITRDLLTIATKGATKTQLVYQTNINFKVLKTYLRRMTQSKLITNTGKHYHPTPKGHQYLEDFNKITI